MNTLRILNVQVYCDESLARGSWDLVAGLWVDASRAAVLRGHLRDIRAAHGWEGGEIKWVKASGRELHPAYRDVVSAFCRLIRSRFARFHCLAVPRSLRVDRSGDASHIPYQDAWLALLDQGCRPGERYFVRLDRRTDLDDDGVGALQRIANEQHRLRGRYPPAPFRSIDVLDSRGDDLIQLVDLIVGGVGYDLSGGFQRAGGSGAKREIVHLLRKRLGCTSLTPHGSVTSPDFRIEVRDDVSRTK